MFTGIIERLGTIKRIDSDKTNKIFWIESDIAPELRIDESVCHNGVCLTIEDIRDNIYRVTAILETINKTNISQWKIDDVVNLERSMKLGERLDGHIVQGHADGTALCTERKDMQGSIEFTFSFDEKFAALIIEKGSVCLNGVSLTAFNVTNNHFTVAIIPYTFNHTNFKSIHTGYVANIEFDILGKYVQRLTTINEKK
ncbi:MAG TPA: riboflavin synthase [Chitinophagaceae bacterium]|nr:riboflavin synthase [Chitinophagaceae bacterium]